jgi:hypothetical protein
MTMDEISELIKAVKESTQAQNSTTTENKGLGPPPPPPPIQQQDLQQQQYNEVQTTVEMPKSDVPPPPLAPLSPRQEALGEMAEKKRQKWMREKGKNNLKINFNYLIVF